MAEKSNKVLLQVKNLKVAYGGIQAVKGVDFEVREGELVSLIGSTAPARPPP
jgi:branched-chain amino acid transport system ATP-binding protein